MLRAFLIPAALTGCFCAGFAWLIDTTTDMLGTQSVLALAFVSGFLGSLFAKGLLSWLGRN